MALAINKQISKFKKCFNIFTKEATTTKTSQDEQKFDWKVISKSYNYFTVVLVILALLWAAFNAYSIYQRQADDFDRILASQAFILERTFSESINDIENYLSYIGDKASEHKTKKVNYPLISKLLIKSFNTHKVCESFYSWLDIKYVDNNNLIAVTSKDGILKTPVKIEKTYPFQEALNYKGRMAIGATTKIHNDFFDDYSTFPVAITTPGGGFLISELIVNKIQSDIKESLQNKDIEYLIFDENYQIMLTSDEYKNFKIDTQLKNRIQSNKDLSLILQNTKTIKSFNRKVIKFYKPLKIKGVDFDFYNISNHNFITLIGYSRATKIDFFLNQLKHTSIQILGVLIIFLLSLYIFKRVKIIPIINEASASANRTKTQFLSNMSHELRTPLNGIVGMSLILSEANNLNKEQKMDAAIVYNSSVALLAILNDILDFSKIERGLIVLTKTNFELKKVIEDLADFVMPSCAQKGLEIITYISPDVPKFLIGDQARVRQILSNLIYNGIKFTKHGQILINIQLDYSQERTTSIVFNVEDSGIGIEESEINKLFHMFIQTDMSATRKFGGTGLGLAICKELVYLMGGKIGIKSDFGKGSNFWASIPFEKCLDDGLIKNEQILTNNIKKLKDKNIVIIESFDVSRAVMSSRLQDHNIKTHLILFNDDDDQGEHIFTSLKNILLIDAILISYHSDNKFDFIKLIKRIKNDQFLADIPLILLVSHFNKNDIDVYLRVEFAQIINKPAKDQDLFDALLTALKIVEDKTNNTKALLNVDSKNRKRVLICDDNKINLKVVGKFLENVGYKIDYAENGQDGLNKFMHLNYDAVLMDCQMPIMDGFIATKAIRNIEISRGLNKRIPVIALTGNVTDADKKMCFDSGMDDFMTKPVIRNELLKIVQYWLKVDTQGVTKKPLHGLK
jgi:signal transduction histidine kinase/PleD family two-component response regulator